jgi:hypothetical protein
MWADFYNSRHALATQNGEPARALAEIPKTGSAGGEFDKHGVPWPLVMHDDETRTCSSCGGQTARVDNSFDADEKSSTWSNLYRCPNCSERARFVTPLTASEHKHLFEGRAPGNDVFVITSLEPSGAEATQTPTATAAAGNTNPSTTPRKETTPMAIAGTELGNLDEVDGEAKTALTAIEALTEALNEIKGWGGNLPDRWSGTAWSTDRLDTAISGVAEASSELKIPEALMEQLAEIGAAVAEARSVGEVAADCSTRGTVRNRPGPPTHTATRRTSEGAPPDGHQATAHPAEGLPAHPQGQPHPATAAVAGLPAAVADPARCPAARQPGPEPQHRAPYETRHR